MFPCRTPTLLLSVVLARVACADALEIEVRDSFLPGVPVLVRAEIQDGAGRPRRDLWDAEVRLTVRGAGADVSPERIELKNGAGSRLVAVAGEGEVELVAMVDELELVARRRLRSAAGEPRLRVAGILSGGVTEWSGIVEVTADTRVPAGSTLRVLAGALVLLGGGGGGDDAGLDLDVAGRLEVLGTAARPVTFTALEAERAWGELHFERGSEGFLRHAVVTRAGRSPALPIAAGGAALRLEDATLDGEAVAIADLAGQGIYARSSTLRLARAAIARGVVGIQADGSDLDLAHCRISEMFGESDEDDNDFMHIRGRTGDEVARITDCVFADGTDDAIDLHEIDGVVIEGALFRGLADKGLSVFRAETFIRRSLFVANDIAISTKSVDAVPVRVHVERSTFADNRIAIEANDKQDVPAARIYYDVASSILRARPTASSAVVRTDYDPSFITIHHSNLSAAWRGGASVENATDDPRFLDAGARNYALRADSPCVDRGDPAAPADPDGTPADQGAFPVWQGEPPFLRGDANADLTIDLADPVLALFHLVFDQPLACADAADADDSGGLDLADALFTLNFLFLGGPPPRAPRGECGADSSADDLDCAEAACS